MIKYLKLAPKFLRAMWKFSRAEKKLVNTKHRTIRLFMCLHCKDYDCLRCQDCGCFVHLKTYCATESCPKQYWQEVK